MDGSAKSDRDSPFLTTEEAAKYLRLSRYTLERKRSQGGGPRYRNHGIIVYHTSDLDAWSRDQERERPSRMTPGQDGPG